MFPTANNSRNKFWFALAIFAAIILIPWSASQAATLDISGSSSHVAAGEQYTAVVYLDTGRDNINAISGTLVVSSEFSVQAIRDGGSIIDFWVQAPTMTTGTTADGSTRIIFSGVMSGGVNTNRGTLFSLLLLASGASAGKTAALSFDKAAVLKSDGLGTPATVVLKSLTVAIAPPAALPVTAPTTPLFTPDTVPPEQFTPAVARNKSLFNNKYFVIFLARDNNSGLDYYEVQESDSPTPGSIWRSAVSPHLLSNQKLTSYIFVKAVDRAGNVRLTVVLPRGRATSYQKYLFWCILGIVVLTLLILLVKRLRRGPPSSKNSFS